MRLCCSLLLVFMIMLAAGVVTADPLSENTSQQAPPSPLTVLYSYYSDINLGDYAAAYNRWFIPSMSYQQFAGRFTTSTHIVPYFAPFIGGAGSGDVRSVLLGYRTDGTVESYAGCFNLNNEGTGWTIAGSNFVLLANGAPPSNAAISTLLAQRCDSNPSPDTTVYDQADQMAMNYFDLINRRNYATAYSMWLSPAPGAQPNGAPPRDYRRPFEGFVNGYVNTRYAYVYFGDYQFMGAAAGKPYLQGVLPLVLVGQQSDGGFNVYYGCFVIGTQPTGTLGIVNGRFYQYQSQSPSGVEILNRVNTDCTTLNIPN